jgi:hypothetical protein
VGRWGPAGATEEWAGYLSAGADRVASTLRETCALLVDPLGNIHPPQHRTRSGS